MTSRSVCSNYLAWRFRNKVAYVLHGSSLVKKEDANRTSCIFKVWLHQRVNPAALSCQLLIAVKGRWHIFFQLWSFRRCVEDFFPPASPYYAVLFFLNPTCLCQKPSSKSASLYEGNCFLLTDDLSIAVSFLAHQSSQSDLLQQVHFWVALWHIKTLFGIHTVLLYCLQASTELFMEVAGDMTLFLPKSCILSCGEILCESYFGGLCPFYVYLTGFMVPIPCFHFYYC